MEVHNEEEKNMVHIGYAASRMKRMQDWRHTTLGPTVTSHERIIKE